MLFITDNSHLHTCIFYFKWSYLSTIRYFLKIDSRSKGEALGLSPSPSPGLMKANRSIAENAVMFDTHSGFNCQLIDIQNNISLINTFQRILLFMLLCYNINKINKRHLNYHWNWCTLHPPFRDDCVWKEI